MKEVLVSRTLMKEVLVSRLLKERSLGHSSRIFIHFCNTYQYNIGATVKANSLTYSPIYLFTSVLF